MTLLTALIDLAGRAAPRTCTGLTLKWKFLSAHPAFVIALEDVASTGASSELSDPYTSQEKLAGVTRSRSTRLEIASRIGMLMTPALLVGGFGLRRHRDNAAMQSAATRHSRIVEQLEEEASALQSVIALQRESDASSYVDVTELATNCTAQDNAVSCIITNASPKAVTTCLRGKLTQKDAAGVTLTSQVICTGRLAPRTTTSLTAHWQGGFAIDICATTSHFGNEHLDFDQCTFTTEAVPEDALTAAKERPPAR